MRALLTVAILALLFLSARTIARWLSQQGAALGCKARRWVWIWSTEPAVESAEGADRAAEILRSHGLSRAEASAAHPAVNSVAARLASACDGREFHFYVLPAQEVNAFAVPGGHIFLTAKLVALFASDADALAFVLAHEMSHVTCGHAADKARLQFLGRWIANGLVQQLFERAYSRDQEFEADAAAVHLMRRVGFEPCGARRLLTALDHGEPAGWLSTHPPTAERIAKLPLETV